MLTSGHLTPDEIRDLSWELEKLDVDLILAFPEAGQTDGTRALDNEAFFARVGQLMVKLLAETTADGYAFRVDLRLRPFGQSGRVALSFAAMEQYYQREGRDWERYAWIKARALTGAALYARLHSEFVQPFVYRRYLDFGVFESLREMKQLIEKQVVRRELAEHVKLGPGGIREIEFIVQAFQLIRGGQDRRLQSARIFEVLPLLAGGRLLSEAVIAELLAAYRYLRTLENRLQMLRDEQTHVMPETAEGVATIAALMDVTPEAFDTAYRAALTRVQGYYVEGLYFLTGEFREYDRKSGDFGRKPVTPCENFFWRQKDGCRYFGPGAWQIGMRYSKLDLSNSGLNGGTIQDVTLGINWFWNPNVKWQLNYVITMRDAPAAVGNVGDGTIHGIGMRFAHDF